VNWEEVKELYSADRIITMKVTGHNRGGLLVEADMLLRFCSLFTPDRAGRQDDEDRDLSLETYMGRTLNLKVIECVPEDGRVLSSRSAPPLQSPASAPNFFIPWRMASHVKGAR
jgi:small subunit ribosomal protein S1